jgi:hypothetical protein
MKDSPEKDTSLFTFVAGRFGCSWGRPGITRSVKRFDDYFRLHVPAWLVVDGLLCWFCALDHHWRVPAAPTPEYQVSTVDQT